MHINKENQATGFCYFPVSIHTHFSLLAALQHSPVPLEAAAGATGGSNRSVSLQGGSLSTVVLCLAEDTKLFPMLP